MLVNVKETSVEVTMPKFEIEYDVELSELLSAMGMTDAFDRDLADFSGLAASSEGNIYINQILHKTFITVDENGTKASAVTLVGMKEDCAEISNVVLNFKRPYVYMIIDCEHMLPVFIGTMMEVPS